MTEIGIAAAIEQLRAELTETLRQEDQPIQFITADIELELALIVRKEGSGKAGIKWLVVEVGAATKFGSESVHRVTLKLTPMKRGPNHTLEPLLINDLPMREPD